MDIRELYYVEKYPIAQQTKAIVPSTDDEGNMITVIYDEKGIFYTNERAFEMIKRNCLEYGKDYEGARKSVLEITSFKCKTPIPISSELRLCMFPTESPANSPCCWFNPYHVWNFTTKFSMVNHLSITLSGGERVLNVPVSYKSFKGQVERCNELLEKYRQLTNNRYKFHTYTSSQAAEKRVGY